MVSQSVSELPRREKSAPARPDERNPDRATGGVAADYSVTPEWLRWRGPPSEEGRNHPCPASRVQRDDAGGQSPSDLRTSVSGWLFVVLGRVALSSRLRALHFGSQHFPQHFLEPCILREVEGRPMPFPSQSCECLDRHKPLSKRPRSVFLIGLLSLVEGLDRFLYWSPLTCGTMSHAHRSVSCA